MHLDNNKDHWRKNAAFLEAITEWGQSGFNFLPSLLNSLTQVSYLNKLDINFKYQVKSHLSHKLSYSDSPVFHEACSLRFLINRCSLKWARNCLEFYAFISSCEVSYQSNPVLPEDLDSTEESIQWEWDRRKNAFLKVEAILWVKPPSKKTCSSKYIILYFKKYVIYHTLYNIKMNYY